MGRCMWCRSAQRQRGWWPRLHRLWCQPAHTCHITDQSPLLSGPTTDVSQVLQGIAQSTPPPKSTYLEARKGIPKNFSSQVLAKFGWTFWGEFLVKPFILWIKGPNCSEKSWEGFGWFFAIERLFWDPEFRSQGGRARNSSWALEGLAL